MDLDKKYREEVECLADKIAQVIVAKEEKPEVYKAAQQLAADRAKMVGASMKEKMIAAKEKTDLEKELAEAKDDDKEKDDDKA